ncbi:MAG: hypothetical protein JWP47_911 [Polaromonas sp.]|nr:hypothetical protein [Polaromonas sp.]
MDNYLSKIGITLTVLWVTVIVLFLWFCRDNWPTKMNEWGDFIAGVSAPVAFFWLVLGYFQQGQELRLSTKALRLQAEELKRSVEHQGELVAQGEKALERQMQVFNEESKRRRDAARPKFIPQPFFHSTAHADQPEQRSYRLLNNGNDATNVVLTLGHELTRPDRDKIKVNLLKRGEEACEFHVPERKLPVKVTISYLDAEGVGGEAEFEIGYGVHGVPWTSDVEVRF